MSTNNYVYAKIKIGQGLWWANTSRPSIWYANSINKGDRAKSLLGGTTAEILSKKVYRYYGSDQFDIYITVKLDAKQNKKSGEYSFDRSPLAVGLPIEILFPREVVSGTVIELNDSPITEKLVEKTIYLSKRGAFPWELDAIHIGDSFSDGENTIFEIIDKEGKELNTLTWDSYGNNTADTTEASKYITIKAKIKLKKIENQWIFGEDQIIAPGRNMSISTPGLVYDNYVVSRIE